jgi:hypothetical protein
VAGPLFGSRLEVTSGGTLRDPERLIGKFQIIGTARDIQSFAVKRQQAWSFIAGLGSSG